MGPRNRDFENIRHYSGIIRDLQAQLNDALARIKVLEDKKPSSQQQQRPNIELFFNNDLNKEKAISQEAGVNEDEIKALVSQWLQDGELPISLHDHTTNVQGGSAYANKGAALK